MKKSVQHYPAEHRYALQGDHAEAVLTYEQEEQVVTITHTFVPVELRGQGIAEQLVRAALADARASQQTIVPQCSYVARFIEKHTEFQDLVQK